jgi:nucleoside-diphosphate-sugar epimerase
MNSVEYSDNAYQSVRTAVLGASGFVGRWVARALSAQGAEIYLIDTDASRTRKISSRYAVKGDIIEVNKNDHNAIPEIFKEIRPSITFNLAGYGVIRTECDRKTAYSVNVQLVKDVAKAIAAVRDPAWPGADIVHVGTAMEYGDIRGDLSEDSIPNPTTLYGRSKLAGTLAFSEYCRAENIKGLTARLFMLYGPGEHSSRLLPSLIKIAATGESLELTAGLHKRDFNHIEDVAEGLLRLGLCTPEPGQIVNLATGKLTSIRHFVEIAAEVLNIEPDKLKFGAIPTRKEEMNHSEVALARARQLIGWIPTTGILKGIRRTLKFTESF